MEDQANRLGYWPPEQVRAVQINEFRDGGMDCAQKQSNTWFRLS